jgi:hypothetical protein
MALADGFPGSISSLIPQSLSLHDNPINAVAEVSPNRPLDHIGVLSYLTGLLSVRTFRR